MFKRRDNGIWQFLAGGGEDAETPLQAAARETFEEIGISAAGRLIPLESIAYIPKAWFAEAEAWGEEVQSIPEYCFALEVGEVALTLSEEHTEARWVSYAEAHRLLRWDSNRRAMGECRERVKNTKVQSNVSFRQT